MSRLLVPALWVAGAIAAHACDFALPRPAELVNSAAMVFVGRVLPANEPAPSPLGEPLRFFVEEAFQGVSQGRSVSASSGVGDCVGVFRPGEKYLVFLQPARAGELPSAGPPSGTVRISEAPAVLRWLRNRTMRTWNSQLLGTVWDIDSVMPGYHRKALPGATIAVRKNGRVVVTATSDQEGVYQVDGLSPGEYEISASSPGHYVMPSHTRVEGCCAFADLAAFTGGQVEGIVRNAAGTPIDGIRVEIVRVWPQGQALPFRDAETANGGRFFFRGIPPGPYRVGVNVLTSATVRQPYATTFRSISLTAQQQMRGVDLALPQPLAARGVLVRVLTPDGRRASGARVLVADEPGYTAPIEIRANKEGEARLVWVAAARFRVMAQAQDAARRGLISDWRHTNAGKAPVEVTITLRYD